MFVFEFDVFGEHGVYGREIVFVGGNVCILYVLVLNLSVPGCVCLPPFSLSNLCPVHSRISLVTGSGGPILGCGLWVFPLLVEQEFISFTRHQPCYLINSQVWHLCHLNQKKIKLKPVLLLAWKKRNKQNEFVIWVSLSVSMWIPFML